MVSVVMHWELPVVLQGLKAQKKMWTRWSHTCKAFGVDEICIIDVDGIAPTFGDCEINSVTVRTLDEALSNYSGAPLVFVEEGGAPLHNFEHPEACVYVFGSDYSTGLAKADVSINSSRPLHADVACGIVLSHRRSQWR